MAPLTGWRKTRWRRQERNEPVLPLIILLAAAACRCVQGWRHTTKEGRRDTTLHWVPDYQPYYYDSLKQKLDEVMSINNCTLLTQGGTGEVTGYEVPEGSRLGPDITVRVVPPPRTVRKRWGSENHELFNVSTLYMRTTGDLCTTKKYLAFKKGMYKLPKGCMDLYAEERGQQRKQVIRYGATLHPNHVRCDNKASSSVCVAAGQHKVAVPVELRRLHQYPFLVTAKDVLVARSGVLLPPCGPVALLASCEAVMWSVKRAREVANYSQICRDAHAPGGDASTCPFPVHNRVFVMAQYDDGQIGQFMQESLPKVRRFLFVPAPSHYRLTVPHAFMSFMCPRRPLRCSCCTTTTSSRRTRT
jgi:hypothetical protein